MFMDEAKKMAQQEWQEPRLPLSHSHAAPQSGTHVKFVIAGPEECG
jgi:hypothetical protein